MVRKVTLLLLVLLTLCGSKGWAQILLDGKKWTQYGMSSGTTLLGGNLQGAAYYDGKIYSFKQVNVSGQSSTNNYNVYDIATNKWTPGAAITCAPNTHMGSAAFAPNVVSSYEKDGTTYNCTIPFVFVSGHSYMNTDGSTGSTKYIYCAVVDIENNQLITRFAFPDRYDDCILAYDFNLTNNTTRVWVIGYQSQSIGSSVDRKGKSPYVIEEYQISNDIFLSQNPSKTVFTHSDSEYKGMMMGGGPNAEGIQETLECGTVQDVFYNDNHLYLCTGRGSEYNRTEYVKVHCFDVTSGNHHIEKTIVTPEYGESQGIVCDGDNNIWVLVSGGTGKMWKYSAGTGYDNFNFQEPAEVSPATTPATYNIANGSELCWFLQQVYGGRTTINAKLANNIDLSGITLPTSFYVYMDVAAAITSGFDAQYAFRGTFDGEGHSITNLSITKTPYYNNGLFPYCIGATVENVTVSGTITPTTCRTSAGNNQPVANIGMIGYMDGGTVSNVDVSGLTINEANTASGTVNKVIGYGTGDIIMNGVTGVETYTITWKDNDESIIKQTQVFPGSVIIAPATPDKSGYIFQAWSPAYTEGTTASANATYTATYVVNPYDSNGFNVNFSTCAEAEKYQPATLVDGWYEIDNAGKMFWFANQVNAGNATYNAKVTKDIDMDGTNHTDFPGIGYYISTAGGDRKPFSGNFDGQGHRIYNCNITTNNSSYWGSGLIGYATGVNKTIKNFTLEGSITAKCGARAGGVLGYVADGYSISGITSSVDITSTTLKTGGLAGFISTSTVSKCRFNGTISNSNNFTAGLIAEVLKGCTISDCLFDGTINATRDNADVATGGIAGIIGGQTSNTVSNCLSYGTITTKKTGTNTGKVFGRVDGALTISNVYYGAQATSTPTIDYNANGKTITGSVTAITTQTWNEIKKALNNGRVPTVWGISSKDYPVPGDVDATQYTLTFNSKGGSECSAVTKVANSVITLPTTTKDGFGFAGWTVAEDGTGTKYAAGASYTITDDVTLYAQWTETFTVTFNSKGGSACASVSMVAGTQITLPTPTKDGYVFNNWNTAENGSGTKCAAGANYTITANATLYAQWTEAYTITFNSKGGSACEDVSNVAGTQITLPTPTRDEYLFNGWNTKEDGSGTTYAAGANYTITASATLYAQWTADETGDYRNGFHKTHAKTEADYYQEPVEVTAENYASFGLSSAYVGYYQVKNAGNMFWIAQNLSASNNTRKYVVTADIDMAGNDANHKDWAGIAIIYTSTHFEGVFDGLGHKFTNYYLSITYNNNVYNYKSLFGNVKNATIKNFSIDGQVDIRWPGSQYGSVVGRVNGKSTVEDIYSTVNFTIYDSKTPSSIGGIVGQCSNGSTWSTNLATINRCRYSGTITGNTAYAGLGGILGNSEGVVEITNCLFDGTISTTATPERTSNDNGIKIGGIFGRNTQKTNILNCLSIGTISVPAAADKGNVGIVMGTLTSKNTLTITNTYYSTTKCTTGIGAVGNNSNTTTTAAAPTELAESPDWDAIKTALNAGSTNWGINSQVYPVPGEVDGVLKYTLTWNTDGGTEIASIRDVAGTSVAAPTAPTKTGYTFNGWKDASDNTVSFPFTMPAKNVTLTAQWTINQYTITFDTDGGSTVASITQDYGTAITKPANPTKTGCGFDGWSPAVPSTMPAENITCVAQWSANKYTITFNTNGGTSIDPIKQEVGTAVTAPANPTKTGYAFSGWSPAVPSTMPAENTTCVAQWTINQYTIKFDLNGGTSATIGDITQDYGTDITAPADPTRTDWDFNGWSPAIPSTMPAENITCVAQWSQDRYTNGFNDDWSTCDADKKYEEPVLITAARCAELSIDESYATNGFYEVKNAGNMFWISKNFDASKIAGINTRKFVVTADIDMEGNKTIHQDWAGIGDYNSGTNTKHFMGTFDGLGHKFTNYYMKVSANWKGLFCVTNANAVIKNFTISSETGQVDISGGGQIGVVVGRVQGSTKLEDIHSSVNITVASGKVIGAIGGIIGQAANVTTLNRCRYNGNITGNSSYNALGGIIGNAEGELTFNNCLFDGSISTSSTQARTGVDDGIKIGGICGRNNNKTTITNSMSIGTISVPEAADKGNVGIIIGTQTSNNKLTISNTHFSTSSCTTGIGAVGNNSNTDKTSAAPTELPTSPVWETIRTTLGGANWVIDQEKYGKEYPIPAVFVCEHEYDQYGFCTKCETPEPIGEPVLDSKDGKSYYMIDHFADLGQFAAMVNNSPNGTIINAKVTADIDLTEHEKITTEIGDESHHYCGTFDGQGHTMKGVRVESDLRYVGLFACVGIKDSDASKVKNGIVKNFSVSGTVTATYFSKWNTNTPLVMGVIGEVYSGTVENVHSSVDFKCTSGTRSHIGGVVGGSLHMSSDQGEIVIKNCTYDGTMTLNACDAIGGIVGYAQHKTKISNTMYSGSITQNYTRPVGEEDKTDDPVSTYIGGVLGYCNSESDGVKNSIIVGDMESNLKDFLTDAMSAKKNNMNICVGFDGSIDKSYKNYYGNYITPKMTEKYHQLPSVKFSGTAKVRTDAEFATGWVCAELNADDELDEDDNPWGQILGYQVGPNKDPNSPAQRYPYPGYTDPEQTSYKVVRTQNAEDDTKYDYTADYYFFDDFGDTTPYPTDAASMKVKKIEYTRQAKYMKGYISMCLPWAFTADMRPSGDDTKCYAYSKVEGNEVKFTQITSFPIAAGTPFVMYDTSNADCTPIPAYNADGTEVALTAGTQTTETDGPGIYGAFNTVLTGAWSETNLLYKIDGGKLVRTTANSHCYPFRVYLKLPTSSGAAAKTYVPCWIDFEGIQTNVVLRDAAELIPDDAPRYNTLGQKVSKYTKGIVIVNGKKYNVK